MLEKGDRMGEGAGGEDGRGRRRRGGGGEEVERVRGGERGQDARGSRRGGWRGGEGGGKEDEEEESGGQGMCVVVRSVSFPCHILVLRTQQQGMNRAKNKFLLEVSLYHK